MNEHNKISETERLAVYQIKDSGSKLTMIFNKDIKTVDISQEIFIRNNEPALEPMESEWIKNSAKYGHWQTIHPTLGRENLEFMYNKYIQLFGEGEMQG